MFNKSFWAMKQDLEHGHGIGFSLFGGQGVASGDKQAILDFNSALEKGVKPAKAWATTMSNASMSAQNMTRDALRAKGSLKDLANGLQTTSVQAKAASVGLKALSVAGNMLLSMGISLAIQGLISLFDYLIHYQEKASEKAQEVAEKSAELAKQTISYAQALEELKAQLDSGEKSTTELTSAFKEQLKAMGYTGTEIDNLIEKYGGLAGAINQATLEALENAKIDANTSKADAGTSLEKAYSDEQNIWNSNDDLFSSGFDSKGLSNESYNKIKDILDKHGKSGVNGYSEFVYGAKSKSAEDIYEYYKGLLEAKKIIEKEANDTGNNELLNSAYYNDLKNATENLKEAAETYGDAVSTYNQAVAQENLAKYLQTHDINSQETFDSYIDSIKNSEEYSESYKQVLIDVANNAFPQFSAAAKDASNSVNKIDDSRTKMISSINDMSEGFEELDKIYSSIKDDDPFDFKLLDDDNFKETFGKLDSYASFIEQITSNSDDIDACQSAFNKLVSEWIASVGILDNVTTENEKLTASMLKQMGIANADELAHYGLEKAKAREYVQSKDNINITEDNINSLINEANSAGITTNAYLELTAKEILFNNNDISTSSKCEQILAIANAAGIASASLSALNSEIANVAGQKIGSGARTKYAQSKGVEVISEKNRTDGKKNGNLYVVGGKQFDNFTEAMQYAEAYNTMQSISSAFSQYTIPTYTGGSKSNSSSSSTKDTKETFDWIETALSRIQRTITNLGKTVSATWKSWTDRNSALKSQISSVTQEINLQANAANKYLSLANSVGLGEGYKSLVRNGTLDISTITDENTINAIKQYQEWYRTCHVA